MRPARDESGAAMALALAFLTLFGLLVAAVLGFSETGLRSSNALAGEGDEIASASGALEGAINRARGDLGVGPEGYDADCFEPPAVNGVTVLVRCEGQAGSGAGSGAASVEGLVPDHALLALSTGDGGEHGISKTVGGSTLAVEGDVFSHSTIDVAGTMTVAGRVRAVGACTGTITATGPVACGSASPADAPDPGYQPEAASSPPVRTVPACGSSWLVTFQPGTYTSASALSALTSGGCGGKVFHFPSGVYYFNFVGVGTHVWTVQDAAANVVGGVPDGWSTGAESRPSLAFPGGCSRDEGGVQFIFGGDSRFEVRGGKVELCAPAHDDQQRIAIYGLPTGGESSVTTTLTPSESAGGFSPQAASRIIDGTTASSAIPSSNPGSSASASFSGFGGLPADVTITSATFRLAHYETAQGDIESVTATVTPASGPPIPITLQKRATLTTESVDLLAAGMSPSVDASSFSVSYLVEAKKNKSATAHLDGVELVLTYAPVGFTAQSGCVTSTPYPSSGSCAFLLVTGNDAGLVVGGTVYAPRAAVDMSGPLDTQLIVERGMVARVMVFHIPASWSQAQPVVRVPPSGAGGSTADRVIRFTARIAGVARVRALVTFHDEGGNDPGMDITIEEWSVL